MPRAKPVVQSEPQQPAPYGHKGTQGARLPGWPEVNCEKLARAMECHPMHLRAVLSGRIGTTLSYIERVAEATGITAADVVARIVGARDEDDLRVDKALQRYQERQARRSARVRQKQS